MLFSHQSSFQSFLPALKINCLHAKNFEFMKPLMANRPKLPHITDVLTCWDYTVTLSNGIISPWHGIIFHFLMQKAHIPLKVPIMSKCFFAHPIPHFT